MPQYIPINPGEVYGCYTVISRSEKKGSQEFYHVQCTCGYQTVIGKSRLRTKPEQCRMCFGKQYTAMMMNKRKELTGQIINGFRILDAVPSKKAGDAAKYLTECCICGHKAEKTIDAMKYKKGERCDFCPPDYHFAIEGSIAVGHLADGTEFRIDAEDIPIVEANHWYVNGGGYLFRRDALTREPYRMHRVILGLSQKDDRVVDHINHDKLDNRKCNLRIVTQAENCVNNLKRCSNTVGHVGIQISKNGLQFTGLIEKNGHTYELIKTHDIEEAAQAYNVAADYLFGVGIGYRNQVMYPAMEFTCSIIERIKAIQEAEQQS